MKKLLIFSIAAASACVAQASYLMWQIDATDADGFSGYNAVRIAYSTDGSYNAAGYLTLQQAGDDTDFETISDANGIVNLDSYGATGPALYADTSAYSGTGYSFFIELINYDNSTSPVTISQVAFSEKQTYANLTDKGYTSDSIIPVTPAAVWHGGSYTAAPEPTSAMLVMMGLGLLALKRKKA